MEGSSPWDVAMGVARGAERGAVKDGGAVPKGSGPSGGTAMGKLRRSAPRGCGGVGVGVGVGGYGGKDGARKCGGRAEGMLIVRAMGETDGGNCQRGDGSQKEMSLPR